MTVEELKAEVRQRFLIRFGDSTHALDRGEAITIAFEIVLELLTQLVPSVDEQRSHVEAHKELESRVAECERLIRVIGVP